MRSINSNTFIVGLIIVQSLFSQTISVKDTLRLQKNKTSYRLTNNFIFPESIAFSVNGEEVKADSIDFINGIIYWENRYEKPVNVLAQYDAIERDLPLSIGPSWENLPTLDSIMNRNSIPKSYFHQKIKMQDESLYTSGTFNRQINLSTQGMSEFSGGLHLNISGELDNNIMLSAVLSDQDMILQPEGNTRNLEDILQGNSFLSQYKYSEEFETKFAEYIGTDFAVSCNSGTSALELIFSIIASILGSPGVCGFRPVLKVL